MSAPESQVPVPVSFRFEATVAASGVKVRLYCREGYALPAQGQGEAASWRYAGASMYTLPVWEALKRLLAKGRLSGVSVDVREYHQAATFKPRAEKPPPTDTRDIAKPAPAGLSLEELASPLYRRVQAGRGRGKVKGK
jgi:hypothetical protein